jgi:hypothetical protein
LSDEKQNDDEHYHGSWRWAHWRAAHRTLRWQRTACDGVREGERVCTHLHRGLGVAPCALAFAALHVTHAFAQNNAQANAASASQVPSLLGGKVQALVANAAGDTLAVAIDRAGVYVGSPTAAGMNRG